MYVTGVSFFGEVMADASRDDRTARDQTPLNPDEVETLVALLQRVEPASLGSLVSAIGSLQTAIAAGDALEVREATQQIRTALNSATSTASSTLPARPNAAESGGDVGSQGFI